MNRSDIETQFLEALHEFLAIELRRRAELPLSDADMAFEPQAAEPIDAYAPMLRLLSDDDGMLLRKSGLPKLAGETRRLHRKYYLLYLKELAREVRGLRQQRLAVMQSKGAGNFEQVLNQTLRVEAAILSLRWLSWKHFAHLPISAGEVRSRLDVISVAWRSAGVVA